jgi:hypothetical protein
MMKKIQSDKQLQRKKKELRKRQHELELLIHAHWIDLKHSLKPKNVAGEILYAAFQKKTDDSENTLADAISQLAAAATKAAVEHAQDWLSERMKKKH